MLKKLFISLLFLYQFQSHCQLIEPKHTFNIELGLPNSFTNKPFHQIMQGLVVMSPQYQYTMKFGLAFGVGVRYQYFQINQFKLPEFTTGGMHSFGAYFKLGYQKFFTEKFEFDGGIKVGYTQNMFKSNWLDTLDIKYYQVPAIFVEPIAKFSLLADERVSYGFFVAYAFQGFGFKPQMIGRDSFGYDTEKHNKVNSSFLTVGFCFSYYFKEKN